MNLYQVDIHDSGLDNIRLIKAVRVIGKTSLVKALEVQTYLTMHKKLTVAAGISQTLAESMLQQLRSLGVSASITVSSVTSPMSFDQNVEAVNEWSFFKRLRRLTPHARATGMTR